MAKPTPKSILEDLFQKIRSIQQKKEEIKAEEKALRGTAPRMFDQVFSSLSPGQALDLYYEIESTAKSLKLIQTAQASFKKAFGRVPYSGGTWQTKCSRCEEAIEIPYRSKQDLSQKQYHEQHCGPCLNIVEEERRAAQEARNSQHEARLEYLKTMPYKEYPQTEHWEGVRLKALKRAGFRCQLCNRNAKLNVHHRTYERRGEEEWNDVIALCERCHQKHHGIEPKEET